MEIFVTIFVFLFILSILVLIHELGHFFVAKKFGIKVEEFGFGFPPKAFGIKRGETLYSINWLPIGGFVKLYGEDEAGGGKIGSGKAPVSSHVPDIKRAFFARPVWQRALVVVAGVVMNLLLAIIIFYAYLFISNFKSEIPLLGDYKFVGVDQKNVSQVIITSVAKGSPAQKSGIEVPSQVLEVNGKKIIDPKSFVEYVSAHKGEPVTLTLQKLESQKVSTITLTPRQNYPKDQGALGVAFFPLSVARLTYTTPTQKIFSGIIHPINLLGYNVSVMSQLISVSVEKKTMEPVSQGFAGPVGIGSVVGTILQLPDIKERVLQLLNLAGILSISLAFFNILPIPALDGGRLFFILVEGITGKKVNQKVESMIHSVGMALLLTLILLITFKDIGQLFSR